jgi:hypothetical protein
MARPLARADRPLIGRASSGRRQEPRANSEFRLSVSRTSIPDGRNNPPTPQSCRLYGQTWTFCGAPAGRSETVGSFLSCPSAWSSRSSPQVYSILMVPDCLDIRLTDSRGPSFVVVASLSLCVFYVQTMVPSGSELLVLVWARCSTGLFDCAALTRRFVADRCSFSCKAFFEKRLAPLKPAQCKDAQVPALVAFRKRRIGCSSNHKAEHRSRR